MDNEVVKLFDSENELESSFSGFENEKVKTPPKKGSKKSSTVSHQSTELGPGKGPGKNLKKKAPMKKRTTKSKSASLKNQKSDNNNNVNYELVAELVSNYFKQAGSSDDTAVPNTSRASAGAYVNIYLFLIIFVHLGNNIIAVVEVWKKYYIIDYPCL